MENHCFLLVPHFELSTEQGYPSVTGLPRVCKRIWDHICCNKIFIRSLLQVPKGGETEVTEWLRLTPKTARLEPDHQHISGQLTAELLPLHWGKGVPLILSVWLLLPTPHEHGSALKWEENSTWSFNFLLNWILIFSSCWFSSKEGGTAGIIFAPFETSRRDCLAHEWCDIPQHDKERRHGRCRGLGKTKMGKQEKDYCRALAHGPKMLWQLPNMHSLGYQITP